MKTTSFDVSPETVYKGTRDPKSPPEPKIACYSPRKQTENAKTTSFEVGPETVYRGSLATKIIARTQNSVL